MELKQCDLQAETTLTTHYTNVLLQGLLSLLETLTP